jgi:hypothetical protein
MRQRAKFPRVYMGGAAMDQPLRNQSIASDGDTEMGDPSRKLLVNCTITAHASPRWKGARTEQQRIENNEQLASQRAEAVKKIIAQQLKKKLTGYSLEFIFDQSILDEDSLPDNSVVVGAVGRGQRDSILIAKGDRSNDDEIYRRVDIDVRLARRLEEEIPTEVLHRYKQPTKSRFWYVSASAGIGLHLGAGVNVIFIELRNLYQKATGVAYAAGGGIGLSGIGQLVKTMTQKELLRAAASASFGDEASFSTDTEVGWGDFHLRRIRFTSASLQIVAGYEWSYLSFSDMGSEAQSIPVGGFSVAADAAAQASVGVGLLYLFDVPADWVVREYTADEWNTHTSRWMTSHSLSIRFASGSSDPKASMSAIDEFVSKISQDFRNQ